MATFSAAKLQKIPIRISKGRKKSITARHLFQQEPHGGGLLFRNHHLEDAFELLKQFGIMPALRIRQLDGQSPYADRFGGKYCVEAEIQKIGAEPVALERGSRQQ